MATRRGGSSILLFMRYDYKSLSSSLQYRNKVSIIQSGVHIFSSESHQRLPQKCAKRAQWKNVHL